MTYTADKYKTLAEKLGDVARRLYSNGHIDDASTVLEAHDALLEIYKNAEVWDGEELWITNDEE